MPLVSAGADCELSVIGQRLANLGRSGWLALVIFALAFSGEAADPPPKAGPCTLAPSLRDSLQQRFGSSRILTGADLYEDERSLFSAEHRGACPGMTTGRFFGPKERPATALVLLEVEPKKNVRLVVARPAMSTWTFFELEDMDQGSTAVVWTEGQRTATTPAEAKTRPSPNDVVVLSGYESWRHAYIWTGRTFDAHERND